MGIEWGGAGGGGKALDLWPRPVGACQAGKQKAPRSQEQGNHQNVAGAKWDRQAGPGFGLDRAGTSTPPSSWVLAAWSTHW